MTLPRIIAIARFRLALALSLRKRRIVRAARSDAARRGHSAQWKRRGDACRRMFGVTV